jgi:hypothetical protein
VTALDDDWSDPSASPGMPVGFNMVARTPGAAAHTQPQPAVAAVVADARTLAHATFGAGGDYSGYLLSVRFDT